jgi:uncharacterized protein YbjT (DUF2867 family)
MKILLTGSTGRVGSQVLRELQKRNANVRVLVRQKSARQNGVEVAEGDLLDPVAVERALEGVDKLYLLNAVVPDELTQGLLAYDLARKHRLQHIVYHSVFRADDFPEVPHFAAKSAIEKALKTGDVPYTIIRPNYFNQNDEALRPVLLELGVYPMPLGKSGVSSVDVRDIAEAAAIALTTEGHFGKTYHLNGPDALCGPKAASIWSEVLGKEINYGGHDLEAFEKQMRQSAPAWSAFDMRMMFQGYLERGFIAQEGDLPALTTLLGHPPRSYKDFARETAMGWKQGMGGTH